MSNDDASVHPLVHTPGPWNAPTDIARGKTRCMVLSNRGDEIARLNHHREEFGADARLIAAAPDLLAVCRVLLGDLSGRCLPVPSNHIEQLRKAIAKATDEVV